MLALRPPMTIGCKKGRDKADFDHVVDGAELVFITSEDMMALTRTITEIYRDKSVNQ